MLLPGTFLGVWNLIKISSREAAESISPAWIQAHGHAQLFGWVGTFILGIGFYSIPKLRKLKPFALWGGMELLESLDYRRTHPLALEHLSMALAHPPALISSDGTGCIPAFLSCGCQPSVCRGNPET